jgi:proteasome alpha subunit
MNMPGYVSPEQLMKDRADFARKGIARGRPAVVLQYDNGILFVTENSSRALHKIAEIYDRIGFAAVGKYHEFEELRRQGIRYADMRGYAYDRADVTARGLANAYAQTLGAAFTTDPKPREVELVVAEVGETPESDQIYRLSYDGSVADEPGFAVMGGQAEALRDRIRAGFIANATLDEAFKLALTALASVNPDGASGGAGAERAFSPNGLEVAVLERNRPGRKFRRLIGAAFPEIPDLTEAH